MCAQCTAVVELHSHAGQPVARLNSRSAAALTAAEAACIGCGVQRRGGERYCGHCGAQRGAGEYAELAEAMRRHNMLELLERAGGAAPNLTSVATGEPSESSVLPLDPPPRTPTRSSGSRASGWRGAAWLLVVSVFCLVVAPRAGFAASREAAVARLRLKGLSPDERLPTIDGSETTVRALLDRMDVLVIIDWVVYLALAVWLLVPYFVSARRPRTGALLALGSFLGVVALHSWWIPPSVSRDMTVRLAILMVLAYVTWRAFREPMQPVGATA